MQDSQILKKTFLPPKAVRNEVDPLDPIDPKHYTAWEAIFDEKEREIFNPDGTLKSEYIQAQLAIAPNRARALEWLQIEKQAEIETYDALNESYAKRGMNWGAEVIAERKDRENYAHLRVKTIKDIRNREDLDSLPLAVEPDDYYDF